jgi:hypothetical protein
LGLRADSALAGLFSFMIVKKEYYIQRPATRAEEDGSTMKDPYLAN